MKAMILAAGHGTRLRPITDNLPKALVEVHGKPLLQRNIEYLRNSGIRDIIVNVHHHAQQIIDWIERFGDNRIKISHEQEQALETAGGLGFARSFFEGEEPFIMLNADILTDLNIYKLLQFHQNNDSLVTLAIRNRDSSRKLLFDKEMQLCGWRNMKTLTTKWSRPHEFGKVRGYAFSGLQVLSKGIFQYLTQDKPQSIIPVYLQASIMDPICGFLDESSYWMDVGSIEKLRIAEDYISAMEG